MAVKRDTALVLAAHARSAILSLLKSHPGLYSKEIVAKVAPKMPDMGLSRAKTENAVLGQLTGLNRQARITKQREGRSFLYYLNEPATRAEKKVEVKLPGKLPSLTVDLIKSTGRARITLGGLVIEVGVVE